MASFSRNVYNKSNTKTGKSVIFFNTILIFNDLKIFYLETFETSTVEKAWKVWKNSTLCPDNSTIQTDNSTIKTYNHEK